MRAAAISALPSPRDRDVDLRAGLQQFFHARDVAFLRGFEQRAIDGARGACRTGRTLCDRLHRSNRGDRQECGCDCDPGSGETGRSAPLPRIEQCGDAHRKVAAAGHAKRGLCASRHLLRQRHELLGVARTLVDAQHGVVAGTLGFETEASPRHPHQRMEPVRGADRAHRQQHGPIAAAHVFELMHDGAAQRGLAPFTCCGR